MFTMLPMLLMFPTKMESGKVGSMAVCGPSEPLERLP